MSGVGWGWGFGFKGVWGFMHDTINIEGVRQSWPEGPGGNHGGDAKRTRSKYEIMES